MATGAFTQAGGLILMLAAAGWVLHRRRRGSALHTSTTRHYTMSVASALGVPSFSRTSVHIRIPSMDHRLFIVIAVIGGHALGLWALQAGLMRPTAELVVPVQALAEMIEPPLPTAAAPASQQRAQKTPAPPQRQPSGPRPMVQPAVQPPSAIAPTSYAPEAQAGASAPQHTGSGSGAQASPSTVLAPSTPAAPEHVALRETTPSTNIDHRFRPAPIYPVMSRHMNEQGVVRLKVLVSKEGSPVSVRVVGSSGYLRLDNIAEQTVKDRWRFSPGTSNGIPVEMEATFDIRFSLDP